MQLCDRVAAKPVGFDAGDLIALRPAPKFSESCTPVPPNSSDKLPHTGSAHFELTEVARRQPALQSDRDKLKIFLSAKTESFCPLSTHYQIALACGQCKDTYDNLGRESRAMKRR